MPCAACSPSSPRSPRGVGPPGVAPGVRRGRRAGPPDPPAGGRVCAGAGLRCPAPVPAASPGAGQVRAFADAMLFTPDGLEQATRFAVAARHAARYLRRRGPPGPRPRLRHRRRRDGLRRARPRGPGGRRRRRDRTVAGVNLRHWPAGAVAHARAEDVVLPTGEAATHTGVWLDPARRLEGPPTPAGEPGGSSRSTAISPTWRAVQGYAAQVPATGAKLAPAFPHAARPAGAEAQWVSWRGDVVECAVWWGPLVETRRAHGDRAAAGSDAVTLTESDAEGAGPPVRSGDARWPPLRTRPGGDPRRADRGAGPARRGRRAGRRGRVRLGRRSVGRALGAPLHGGGGDAVERQGGPGLAALARGSGGSRSRSAGCRWSPRRYAGSCG